MLRLRRIIDILAAITVALLLAGCKQPAATLELDGQGGDAWTFTKLLAGSVVGGACEEVVVESPAGSRHARRQGTHFTAAVSLTEGTNDVRAVCRGGGRVIATSPLQRWTVRLRDTPKAWIRTIPSEGGLIFDGGGSERPPGSGEPLVRYEWRAQPGNPASLYSAGRAAILEAVPVIGKRLALKTPDIDGVYRVALRVTDALGRDDTSVAAFHVANGVARAFDPERMRPTWIRHAIIYGFAPALLGPIGLAGVTARLDDIAALGANAIWVSPVTDSPGRDFGYAVTDHFRVRPAFGSEADFRALIAAAHERGIRVVMDFVPNHVSDQHPYHVDASRHGRASPYFGFFDRDESGGATHYFDWTNLKNLDFDNPEVQRYVIEAFARWVRDFGVDGFRVDVSWGIRERAPEFWRRLRAELMRINPDLLLLAEASARDPYYFQNGFDVAYDWTAKLGQWAWSDAFASSESVASRLRAAILDRGDGVPHDSLVFRFINNNDTGARFITRYGLSRTRVAAAMLLTLPGVPCVYMGDETGAEFEPYAASPPLTGLESPGLRAYYTQLIKLRRAEPALRGTELRMVAVSDPAAVLAYIRPGAGPAEGLLVLLNFGSDDKTVSFAAAQDIAALFERGSVVDLLSGNSLTVDPEEPKILLPRDAALVLRRPSGRRSSYGDRS